MNPPHKRIGKFDKISIGGFKSLRQITDFKFNDINVLVGANGTGKSNFLDFFEMLDSVIYAKNLQGYVAIKGGADDLLFHGGKQTSSINAHFHFSTVKGPSEYIFRLDQNEKNRFVFTKEEYRFSDNTKESIADWQSFGIGHEEAKIDHMPPAWDIPSAWIMYEILGHCRVYQFHDTSSTSPIKTEADIKDNVVLRRDGGNLAAILYDLQENNTRAYEEIERNIRFVLPIFAGFDLTPLYGKIMLRWRQKKNNTKTFSPNLTSDGTLRLMALTTLLCMPEERTHNLILLDEPELGLHPYAIAFIAEMIKSLSTKKQIIIATQSPQFLNDFAIDDIVVTELSEDGETSFNRLETAEYKDWLDDFRIGDMWQENVFGGNPQ